MFKPPSSATNAQKTPLPRALNTFTAEKIIDALQITGKRLPAEITAINPDGLGQTIVTVKFLVNASPATLPTINVPLAMSNYVREPFQVGDQGWVQSADTYIGHISGLASGSTPDLTPPANLAALVFEPISNAEWEDVPDSNALVLQGPDGVSIWDMGRNTTWILTSDGIIAVGQNSIEFQVGDSTITINSSGIVMADGSNNITVNSSGVSITGTLTINGAAYHAHVHSGVTIGGADTGPVTP